MALRAHHQSRCLTGRSRARFAAVPVPVRGRPTGRRAAVVVQANLFARVSRLLKSYANNVVSAQEDPEKLLDQVVTEMQEDLIKMRQAAAQVMASQKQLEAKYKQSQATADDWLRRAELAVQKGEDDLAKEALRRRKAYQETADGLRMQLDQQQKAVDQLLANTRMLEGKLQEAKNKKDTLKARAASAKTSKQIQEMIGSLNTSNSVVAFEKMEEKVLAMEAEAESTALLVGGDKLENKFAALESGTAEPAGHSRVGSRVRKQVLLLTSSTGAQTLYDVRPGMAAAASSSSGSANASSSSGKEAGVSLRISRARAKTAALLNDPNSSQPPPQLFAKWAGLAEPGKQRQRLLVADMDSYAEVIAAEFYTLEVIGDVLGSRAAASSSTQQQQQPPQGATAAEPDVIDVEALQKSAQAVSGRSRAKKSSSVGLLPSTKPSRTKTKRVLAPPPVIASGSTKVSKPAAAVATAGAATKQAGKTTTVRVKSQAALFTPLRLLQPLVAPLMGGRAHEGSPAAAEAAATAAVLAKAGSKGGTSKSKRGSTRITKTGGSTRVTKAGSTKVSSSSKAGSGTRARGGTTRTTTKAANLLAALPTETTYGDDGGEGASGTVILSRTMKAAVTRAKNQAALFADASKLQELIDAKWVDGEERVWFPAAERAAVDLLGRWFTEPQPQGVSREVAMAELAAAVDAQARKSLKAQFKGKVLLPATPYFDATSLRALLESRVRKGRRLWAKLCDSQPERDWTQEEAAADELALLEWPLWGVWVGWFWDHPSYSPRPGLQGTLVISKTTKLEAGGTTIRRNRQSPTPSPSRTDPASPAAASGAAESVASSNSSSSQLESETVAAVRELLERFSAERREAEATFLAALQQQHAALEATLLRHHEAQASLLMQQHKEQLGARSEEVEWTKQFSKEQIAMLTDFQSKFAKDQIELLRVLSGLQ